MNTNKTSPRIKKAPYGNVTKINLSSKIESFSNKTSLIIRKELNVYGKIALLGIYSLVLVLTVLNRYQNMLDKKFASIEKSNELLAEKIAKITQTHKNSFGQTQSQTEIKDIQRIGIYVAAEVKKQNNYIEKILRSKDKKIDQLKNKLKMKFIIEKKEFEKNLSSLQINNHSSIPFNSKNMKILKYQQNLKIENYKEHLAKQKNLYIHFHDLNNDIEKTKFKKFLNEQKTSLYKLRITFNEVRKKFRKDNYLNN